MDTRLGRRMGRGRGRRYGLSGALGFVIVALGLVLQAVPVAADSWTPAARTCISGNGPATYTVPAGTRYVEVEATGGTGFGGATATDNNTGGPGGTGARVFAILPVTPGQQLKVGVGRNGDQNDGYSGRPNGAQSKVGAGQGGGASVVTTAAGNPCLGCELTQDAGYTDFNICHSSSHEQERASADTAATRAQILVVAGGGGGGGGGNTFGSGGAGGNAGANADFSGQFGSKAYGLDTDCGNGGGGGGGTASAAGGGGTAGCFSYAGNAASGFFGGMSINTGTNPGLGGGGNGGGGWYGGGGGGSGFSLGGGGGGAGSSHVHASARAKSIAQDTTSNPSVTITPYQTAATTATLSGTTSGNDWYTSALTITLTAQAGVRASVAATYYAIDNPACSATNLPACRVYTGPFSISSDGLYTLTYFSVDALTVDEAVKTKSFAVTVTNTTVSGAKISSGANPTATTTGAGGSVSVTGSGSGVVGAAVYGANPAGSPVFHSNGTYVDVIAAGSGLTSLTIKNCHLNGGTQVYWWNGTVWALASHQTYDATAKCVTVTVNSSTSPSLAQLTGTVLAAGSPPTITAVPTTADGKSYTAGVWTNQPVTVTFTCSPNATPSAPVTRASDGENQSASGTCTDGLGQSATTTFSGINIDRTPAELRLRFDPSSKGVVVEATDAGGSGLASTNPISPAACTSQRTGEQCLYRATDVAGNATTMTLLITKTSTNTSVRVVNVQYTGAPARTPATHSAVFSFSPATVTLTSLTQTLTVAEGTSNRKVEARYLAANGNTLITTALGSSTNSQTCPGQTLLWLRSSRTMTGVNLMVEPYCAT